MMLRFEEGVINSHPKHNCHHIWQFLANVLKYVLLDLVILSLGALPTPLLTKPH